MCVLSGIIPLNHKLGHIIFLALDGEKNADKQKKQGDELCLKAYNTRV